MTNVAQQDALYRADELARTGLFSDWTGIAAELRSEGYSQVDEALSTQSVRDQLDLACGRARNR